MTVDRFIPIVKANLVLLDQGYTVEEVGRILMLSYGDVNTKPSGLVSTNLVGYHEPTDRYYRKGKYTEEHFITRTNTCRQICKAYLEGTLTDLFLYETLDKGRKVHYTTEDDNIKLRPHQQNPNLQTWEEQYAAANVALMDDPGTIGSAKYYYEIEGTVYRNVTEAADRLGIHPRTVKGRCKSEKFPLYNEKEYMI